MIPVSTQSRSRLTVLALTLMLAMVPLVALPAAASEGPTESHATGFAPVGHEPIALADAFPEQGEVDLQVLGGWYRQQIRDAGGFDVPMAHDDDVAGHHGSFSGRLLYPMAAGDLDGDGIDDVLMYELDYQTFQISTRGIKSDGTELWHADAAAYGSEDLIPVVGDDLDGDGTFDVLMMRLVDHSSQGAGQCAGLLVGACAEAGAALVDIEFQAVRGQDGSTLWTEQHQIRATGAFALAYAFGIAALAITAGQAVAIEGLPGIPALTSDISGDGGMELSLPIHDVLFVYDVALVYAVIPYALGVAVVELVLTDVTVLQGADGATLGQSSSFPSHGLPTAAVVGDVDSDGDDDLGIIGRSPTAEAIGCAGALIGTCAFVPQQGGLVLATQDLHGDGILQAHTVPAYDTYGNLMHFTDDIDGDGILDAVTVTTPVLLEDRILTAHSMGEASTLWDTEVHDLSSLAFADLDGDGVIELLVSVSDWGEITVGALDGRTGDELGYSTVPSDLDYVYFGALRVIDDIDGDDVQDIAFLAAGHGNNDIEQTVAVLTGFGSQVAWSADLGHTHTFPDANRDTILYSTYEHGGLDEVSLYGLDTSDGTVSWNTTVIGTWFSFFGVAGGDLDNDGVDDSFGVHWTEVYGDDETNGTYSITALAHVEAISGATGATLWNYGDEMPTYEPPQVSDQDDAGSGTDAGDGRDTAVTIGNGTHDGALYPDQGDDEDWYRVPADDGYMIEVTLDMNPDADFDITLYQGSDFLDASAAGGSASETVDGTASGNASFYIAVDVWSGQGGYNLSVVVQPPQPEPEPEPVEPHTATFNATGSITCAASANPVQSNDLCDQAIERDPQTFAFPAENGLTGLHIELRWDSDAPAAAQQMAIAVQQPVGHNWTEGESTLVVDRTFERVDHLDQIVVHVRVGSDQGLVVDQDFELCVTALYGDATLPEGSTCHSG